MSTLSSHDPCATLLSRTRRAVLAVRYGHADEASYLRKLARAAGMGLGAVQRQVERLLRAGIIRRTARGEHVYCQAERQCPIFAELRGLVVKTIGLGEGQEARP